MERLATHRIANPAKIFPILIENTSYEIKKQSISAKIELKDE